MPTWLRRHATAQMHTTAQRQRHTSNNCSGWTPASSASAISSGHLQHHSGSHRTTATRAVLTKSNFLQDTGQQVTKLPAAQTQRQGQLRVPLSQAAFSTVLAEHLLPHWLLQLPVLLAAVCTNATAVAAA